MRPTYSPSVTDLVGGEKVPRCGDGLDVREGLLAAATSCGPRLCRGPRRLPER
ncbi:hypothetical protein AB0B56_05210 [Streptosporangium canum]|uniref:hypothetical protein n=1 Tax=Streptosporangium canum TaxID=324952 RepID=UPI00342B8A21